MKKFALVILTTDIKVKKFEYKDDFETARQIQEKKDVPYIVLKWHEGAGVWMKPEVW